MSAKDMFKIGNIVKLSKEFPFTLNTMRMKERRGVVVGFSTECNMLVEVFWTNIRVSKKAQRTAYTYQMNFIEKCEE
ncbi:MAG: hypothetical protein KAS04_03860 [Candidatus Aenigmarchaeota archaeon]|nr:hypothetical protein [Candidatus Aenigmarchaeota archaeon]MCK5640925.1 hypothetical protein [Gammaproteobacteria bacterium]